ncbi:DUF3857 domain-containing protein [Croceiramulus getboli]|nr:DUF3857 domain-containing protein [Flavobacteriaceae bacterium YJPT1-3]
MLFRMLFYVLFFKVLLLGSLQAQNYDYGKAGISELEMTIYPQDSTANAVLLNRYRNTYFDHDYSDGWVIITEIRERIKILTKEGLEHATKIIAYYRDGVRKEKVLDIEGFTYTLSDGNIHKQELQKEGILITEHNDHWSELVIVMPQAKVGSVIEYKYKVYSPFWKIEDVVLQEDIPVAHQFVKVQTPSFFHFQRMIKGFFPVQPKEYTEERTMNVSFDSNDPYGQLITQQTNYGKAEYEEVVAEYTVEHIPRLREETFVGNLENYRSKVIYELTATKFPGSDYKSYSNQWEDVVQTIYDSDRFGRELKRARHLNEWADEIQSRTSSPKELMNKAFDTIKRSIAWNSKQSKYVDQGLEAAVLNGMGNVAEVNLNLVALLQKLDLEAHPVLVSTRDHGIPVIPTLEGFNYVLAAVRLNDELILLDATERMSSPNLLPERTLNWVGRLIEKNGNSFEVDLYPESPTTKMAMMNYELKPDGSLQGIVMHRFTQLDALDYRKTKGTLTPEQHVERLISTHNLSEVAQFTRKHLEALDAPVEESYEFKLNRGADIMNDKIYLDPLLFLRVFNSPWKGSDRTYPIEFVQPFKIDKRINIKLPAGFTVESMPEPQAVALPDNMGSFSYNIGEFNGSLRITAQFSMNRKLFLPDQFAMLKEFYQTRVNKENEKVVLVKAKP